MYIESYKKLIVWQKSVELSKEIYKVTNRLPKEEVYGLVSQMRRSVISIPSNIAEGYKRNSLGEYVQFLSIADGSAAELETQLILVKDLYSQIDLSLCENLLLEIQKMLTIMIKKLKDKKSLGAKRSTLNANSGFSLIELLLIMGITAIVGTVGFMVAPGFRTQNTLDLAIQELLGNLRDAQQRATSQDQRSQWGVHLEADQNGNDFYKIFYGSSYAAGTVTQTISLSPALEFLSPAQGAT